jgi:hypothetical protein
VNDGPLLLKAEAGKVTFVNSEVNTPQRFWSGIVWDDSNSFASFPMATGAENVCRQIVDVGNGEKGSSSMTSSIVLGLLAVFGLFARFYWTRL